MKKVMKMLPPSFLLAACAAPTGMPAETAAVGMPNPASQYCEEQGGRVEIKQDAQGGEYGLCHLPDGRVLEEWTLFRSKP